MEPWKYQREETPNHQSSRHPDRLTGQFAPEAKSAVRNSLRQFCGTFGSAGRGEFERETEA
jgi:hypothetical protein